MIYFEENTSLIIHPAELECPNITLKLWIESNIRKHEYVASLVFGACLKLRSTSMGFFDEAQAWFFSFANIKALMFYNYCLFIIVRIL